MLQDALGQSWRHLVRSWTLWDASGSLQDTLGGLKHYACSVFWDDKSLQGCQQPGRRTPPRRIFSPFFHYLMNSHSENIFSVSYILHILTYSYVLGILINEYIQSDWFGFIHNTLYTPRGTRPRRISKKNTKTKKCAFLLFLLSLARLAQPTSGWYGLVRAGLGRLGLQHQK